MINLSCLCKEFSQSSSATGGITGYVLEGQKKRKADPRKVRRFLIKASTVGRAQGTESRVVGFDPLWKRQFDYSKEYSCPACAVSKTANPPNKKYTHAHEDELSRKVHTTLILWAPKFATQIAARMSKVDLRLLTKDDQATDDIVNAIISQLDMKGFSVGMADSIRDDLKQAFAAGGIRAANAIGFNVSTNMVNDSAAAFAQERSASLVGMSWDSESGTFITNPDATMSITDTTREALRDLTTAAVQQGWSAKDLQQGILSSNSFSEGRAMTIARTELSNSYIQGNINTYQESGVVTHKSSLLADTHDLDDECDDAADQGIIEFDDIFDTDDGDFAPPFHPNCLCDLLPYTDAEMQEEDDSEKVDIGLLLKKLAGLDAYVAWFMDVLELSDETTKGDVAGHEFHGNKWTGGIGGKPKPTATEKSKAIKELLASGHGFTVSELANVTGASTTYVTKSLKAMENVPHNGLTLIKSGSSWKVVEQNPTPKATEIPKATATPKPDLTPPPKASAEPENKNEIMTKEAADTKYQQTIQAATEKLGASKGQLKDLTSFKQSKQDALAAWKANTTGEPQTPKAVEEKVYAADAKLYSDLKAGTDPAKAYTDWKTNTALEKQGNFQKDIASGKLVIEKPAPTEGAAAQGIPKDIVPAGYQGISAKDFDVKTNAANGTFAKELNSLKGTFIDQSKDNASNKRDVENLLTNELKGSPNFQWVKEQYEASHPHDYTLEAKLVSKWAGTSGDNDEIAVAMQLAVRDVFKMDDSALSYSAFTALQGYQGKSETKLMQMAAARLLGVKGAANVSTVQKGFQEFIAAQYRVTQKFLKDEDIKDVYVARGMTIGKNDKGAEIGAVKLQPASSFSLSYSTARNFSGGQSIFMVKVPASQVLGTYLTGYGCTNEHEVVVLAHQSLKAIRVDGGYGALTIKDAAARVRLYLKDNS